MTIYTFSSYFTTILQQTMQQVSIAVSDWSDSCSGESIMLLGVARRRNRDFLEEWQEDPHQIDLTLAWILICHQQKMECYNGKRQTRIINKHLQLIQNVYTWRREIILYKLCSILCIKHTSSHHQAGMRFSLNGQSLQSSRLSCCQ